MTDNETDTYGYVLERYHSLIEYYWNASSHNKRAYKFTRSLTIVLGACVTLISSISTAEFISSNASLKLPFAIATPILAAILTIAAGFAQSFHWGAAWRDMVINAQKLEKELDRFTVTPPDQIDLAKEVVVLNELVIDETEGFFQRILDSAKILRKHPKKDK